MNPETLEATETTQTLHPDKKEAFAQRMVGILNDSSLALMMSIGHQTGLFDTMAKLPPSTSEQIAKAARLKERYVREWLGAMLTGRVVEYNPANGTYFLPPEHSASLTRAAGPENLALYMQYIPLLGNVEEGIIKSFRKGGGVPYSAYPKFQKIQSEDSSSIYDATLVQTTLPIVPGIVERLKAGIEAADIGCGSGHAVNLMARAFPKSRFTGYDFSKEGIAAAKAEAKKWKLSNTRFMVQDVSRLHERDRFDFITTFDAVHDQAKPKTVLKALARALKPDGVYLMVDIAASSNVHENIDHPLGSTLYTVSCLHCMTVSLALKGEGLGAMWGKQKALEYLAEAGFSNVVIKEVPGDIFNYYYIARKN